MRYSIDPVLKSGLLNLCLCLAPVACIAADESQIPDGAILYKQFQCHICHGEDGTRPAEEGYPIVAGQKKSYVIRQLIDIRDGVRDNGQTRLMRPLTASMTNAEAAAIAEYLSTSGDET
jgi:cytochrome c553